MLTLPICTADNRQMWSSYPEGKTYPEGKFSKCLPIYMVEQGDELSLPRLSLPKYVLVFYEFECYCLWLNEHGRIYYLVGSYWAAVHNSLSRSQQDWLENLQELSLSEEQTCWGSAPQSWPTVSAGRVVYGEQLVEEGSDVQTCYHSPQSFLWTNLLIFNSRQL